MVLVLGVICAEFVTRYYDPVLSDPNKGTDISKMSGEIFLSEVIDYLLESNIPANYKDIVYSMYEEIQSENT